MKGRFQIAQRNLVNWLCWRLVGSAAGFRFLIPNVRLNFVWRFHAVHLSNAVIIRPLWIAKIDQRSQWEGTAREKTTYSCPLFSVNYCVRTLSVFRRSCWYIWHSNKVLTVRSTWCPNRECACQDDFHPDEQHHPYSAALMDKNNNDSSSGATPRR